MTRKYRLFRLNASMEEAEKNGTSGSRRRYVAWRRRSAISLRTLSLLDLLCFPNCGAQRLVKRAMLHGPKHEYRPTEQEFFQKFGSDKK
jgi:hypothetical protein